MVKKDGGIRIVRLSRIQEIDLTIRIPPSRSLHFVCSPSTVSPGNYCTRKPVPGNLTAVAGNFITPGGTRYAVSEDSRIVVALAVKQLMEREKIPDTVMRWPGVAEELVGTKAFYVCDGHFKDVDACIFTHVGDNLVTSYGDAGNHKGIVAGAKAEAMALPDLLLKPEIIRQA